MRENGNGPGGRWTRLAATLLPLLCRLCRYLNQPTTDQPLGKRSENGPAQEDSSHEPPR